MSAGSEQDRLDPNHPLYYAPRRSGERSGLRPVPSPEATAERAARPGSPAVSLETGFDNAASEPLRHPPATAIDRGSPQPFDTRPEKAVSRIRRHPLDPEVIHEHPDLARQRLAMVDALRRFALPIGIAAVVALFFVIMVPAPWHSESAVSSFSGVAESMRTDPPQAIPPQAIPPQLIKAEAEPKSALAEFQAVLAPSNGNEPAMREQPGELLRGFVEWRQKSDPAEPAQK
jgi:hypothetical protein